MEHDHLNKLSITFQQKDQCEIWWKLAKWFLKNHDFIHVQPGEIKGGMVRGSPVMPLGRVSGRRVVFVVGVSRGYGDAGCLLLSRLDCSASDKGRCCLYD